MATRQDRWAQHHADGYAAGVAWNYPALDDQVRECVSALRYAAKRPDDPGGQWEAGFAEGVAFTGATRFGLDTWRAARKAAMAPPPEPPCPICGDTGYTADGNEARWVCDCSAALQHQWERDDPLPDWMDFERHVAILMG